MNNFKYLGKCKFPDDLKKLNITELTELAEEIRTLMINTVSKNGGHLSSNLGVVELSIALHKVFNSPEDKIVWDVGHQIYTHKILTGRFEKFNSLRTEDGISGFSAPNESLHDTFYSGHSSTSISSALGIATANKQLRKDNYAIAVIGDGALTGGLAYEALNNAGRSKTKLIVILNDNEMSISKNVGSMARYLAVIRSKPEYFRLKARTEKAINLIPVVGEKISKEIFNLKTRIKNRMYKSTFFEELGFRYMGPIDGNNIEQLAEALDSAKLVNGPVLLHISTVKGKGYDFAEQSPSTFHGISKFDIESGEPAGGSANFSSEFGETLCSAAEKNEKICAITAAMSLGTGLKDFSEKYPDRFFDVGIAEEHAVTFASGLAKGGMIPVVAVYSTFLQRAYDQLIHDGTLQKQKVIIALDRAGFVGEDGITHQGLLDVSYLNSIPDITVYSPFTFNKLKSDFESAVNSSENLTVIRYPRGSEVLLPDHWEVTNSDFDLHSVGKDILIITYGRLAGEAAKASNILKSKNLSVSVLVFNKIKPISNEAVKIASEYNNIYFYEESVKSGSIGESFADMLLAAGFKGNYEHISVKDEFVPHASVKSLLEKYSLDCMSMINKISESTMAEKKRLDTAVFELGLAESRSKAAALIMAGQIFVNGQKETKAGYTVKEKDNIELHGKQMPFVSRGGYKLEKAMKTFGISLKNNVCMDIGASTGGFTDCMLQSGAVKVYSIDVGYGQLAWKLRTDERVVNLERTNFRYLTKETVTEEIDFASIDVSFISLKKILPVLYGFLKDGGETVALIKPQFEAGREKVGKKGVVRDIETHKEVIRDILSFAFESGFSVIGLDFSPIRGPEGNIEYLMYLAKNDEHKNKVTDNFICEIADKSHNELSGE